MIDRDALDACVHCGLCLPACPTYAVTGNEADSPRGRITLVRALSDARADGDDSDDGVRAVAERHLDLCLGCRACETACPSGVRYGSILESARVTLGGSSVLARLLARPWGARAVARGAWIARRLGVLRIARAGSGRLGVAARVAPRTTWRAWSRTVPPTLAATAPRRGSVVLLPGCVMDHGFGDVHAASTALLRAAGFDVHVPRGPLCCGALAAHAGDAQTSRDAVERLAAALPASGFDALVVDAAGCGAHLKEARWAHAARTFDVLEFLDRHGLAAPLGPIAQQFGRPAGERLRVAYADPCHLLHAQRIAEAPRRLCRALPDVNLVPLPGADRCCGSAGVYNLLHPAMAGELLRRKVADVRGVAPHVLATANPGCQLQLASALEIPVVHVATLLAAGLPRRP